MQRRKTKKSELRVRRDRVDPIEELRQLKTEQLRAISGGRSEYDNLGETC